MPEVPDEKRRGFFVAVVGPSGAGKDSLINAARDRLGNDGRFVFARRLVTRSESGNEAHDTLDPDTFEALQAAGAFALSWKANGLGYALPATVMDALAQGRHVIANLSREQVQGLRFRFERVLVVHVTADAAVLRERLALRGRETPEERELRLQRALQLDSKFEADLHIINNGALSEAAERFIAVLADLE